jgi:small ligand-binding sensory domain FIST
MSERDTMAMSSASSSERASDEAAAEAAERALAGLGGSGGGSAGVDLAMVFVSAHHAGSMRSVGEQVARRLNPRAMIGVTGEAVVHGFLEMEGAPSVAILAARLPGVRVHAFRSDDLPFGVGLAVDPDQEEDEDLAALAQAVGIGEGFGDHRATILFADPFSVDMGTMLPAVRRARALAGPGGAGGAGGAGENTEEAEWSVGRRAPIVGGMASASNRPGGNALLVDGRVVNTGLVGVTLSVPRAGVVPSAAHGAGVGRGARGFRCDAVVSQGCRAFGPNMVVTSARGQIIRTLSGKPALAILHAAIEELGEDERQLLSRGLMVGRVVNEYKDRFGPGDYLMRSVVGVSKEDGAIAVADHIRVGQTVRLHVRDADTAKRDLELLMDGQSIHERPMGALLVTCAGRGAKLFGAPNHDASAVQRAFIEPASLRGGEERAKGGVSMGPRVGLPLAGFFAAGEIGPVNGGGDGVFLHQHTACALLFRGE